MLAKEKSAYGGDLLKTRAGRRRGRPISTRDTMHLVLRSTKAKGDWSFRKPKNAACVNRIIDKFAVIYSVRVISMANVGNHLHMQIKLSNRFTYKPFIRAVTAAIAMAITGRNRWTAETREQGRAGTQAHGSAGKQAQGTAGTLENRGSVRREKFWDYRPFTRIVESFKALLNLKDYIKINQLEGEGYNRDDARFMLKVEREFADTA